VQHAFTLNIAQFSDKPKSHNYYTNLYTKPKRNPNSKPCQLLKVMNSVIYPKSHSE